MGNKTGFPRLGQICVFVRQVSQHYHHSVNQSYTSVPSQYVTGLQYRTCQCVTLIMLFIYTIFAITQFSALNHRPANLESKKILRFLYLYCSIAVCSKKKLVHAMLRPKKKKKKKKKRSRLFSKTVRFELLPLSRVVKP